MFVSFCGQRRFWVIIPTTMLAKIPPLKIDSADPFRDDALARKRECENLADNIVSSETKTPFVLAVNASWGAGKTVFLRMLEAVCKSREIPTVFFNAWEADFHNDALAAMIGEVGEQIPAKPKSDLAKSADIVKKAGREMLSRRGLGEMVKGALKSAAGAAGLDAIVEGALKSLKNFDPAAEYCDYRAALQKFKDSLSAYVAQSGKPLVFFVDELDRCRPVFAVEVLEKIKHIFDVEGVFFVVAVNKEELAKTIRSVYGDIDVEVYLRKFFDGKGLRLESKSSNFASSAARRTYVLDGDPGFVTNFCNMFSLQPRDQEQVLCEVQSILRLSSVERMDRDEFEIVVFFAVLAFADAPLFEDCMSAANSDDCSKFPFAKVADLYYEKWTAPTQWMASARTPHWGDRLSAPWKWCAVNGHIWDDKYRQRVDVLSNKEDSIYTEIKAEAKAYLRIKQAYPPSPRIFLNIFGKIGRADK